MRAERKRLSSTSEALPKVIAATEPHSTGGDRLSAVTALDDLARVVDGTFVVVVEHPGAKYRRRCFLTAASAQRSARGAQERGLNAVVYMAELKPLWRITGDS